MLAAFRRHEAACDRVAEAVWIEVQGEQLLQKKWKLGHKGASLYNLVIGWHDMTG